MSYASLCVSHGLHVNPVINSLLSGLCKRLLGTWECEITRILWECRRNIFHHANYTGLSGVHRLLIFCQFFSFLLPPQHYFFEVPPIRGWSWNYLFTCLIMQWKYIFIIWNNKKNMLFFKSCRLPADWKISKMYKNRPWLKKLYIYSMISSV